MTRRAGGRGVALVVRSASLFAAVAAVGLTTAAAVGLSGAAPAYASAAGRPVARAASAGDAAITSAAPGIASAATPGAATASAPGIASAAGRAAVGAGATPAPAPSTSPNVASSAAEVTLLDLFPAVPTATDVLTLTGTVTNTSGETLTRLNAYLRMSRLPATDREGLARFTEPGYRSVFRPGPFEPLVESLAAGATATFRLEVAVSELGLTVAGVYPIGVEVLASFEDGTRSEVGSSISLVPWLPPTDSAAPVVEVAVAVPLTAPIDQAADGSYRSERLGQLFAPSGRLGALLGGSANTAANRAAITWLVDPALLEAAADLADGYPVISDAGAGGAPTPGRHADDAADWLTRIAELARADAIALLPYANVDVVALVRAGLTADLAAAIASAPVRAQAALEPAEVPTDAEGALEGTAGESTDAEVAPEGTAGEPTSDVLVDSAVDFDGVTMLYPPGGAVDTATLRALADNGVRGLLLSADTVDAASDAQRVTVPDGLGAEITVVAVDGTLSAIFVNDSRASEASDAALTSVEARQRALAYTAVAALDRTDDGTSDAPLVVVVPPESPDPSSAAALDVLTGAAPWVTPVSLDAALASARAEPGTVSYPAGAAATELSPAYLRAVSDLGTATATLRVLTADSAGAAALDLARLRAESASWRDDPAGGAQLVTELTSAVVARVGAVRIVSTGAVTLSSDSGRFPLTVANDLDQPVTVRLALTARTPARLQTSGPELVEVAAGAKTTIDVSAKATTNGVYVVDARLETADGTAFGVLTPITVRATRYDTVAWVVMGVAGGLIVIGSGIRLARRFRAARGSTS